MPALARLVAVLAAAAAPLVALAQQGPGGSPAGPRAGYSWLWILVAALVVVALFRVLIGRNRPGGRPKPPARTP